MQKRKVLLTGPIANFGGREIEAATIARALEDNGWEFKILSTTYIDKSSQVHEYIPSSKISSFNQILINKKLLLKISSTLSAIWNLDWRYVYKFAGNYPNKKFLNFDSEITKIISEEVSQAEIIIFLGQPSSNYVHQFISISKDLKKPFLFRITGITNSDCLNKSFDNVSAFLFHSYAEICDNYYSLIFDQSLLNEKSFLSIALLDNKIKNFIIVGTVSEHKRVEKMILFFSKVRTAEDKLVILGEGPLKSKLKNKFKTKSYIDFLSSSHKTVYKHLEKADCLILGSISETGPLVCLEAMATGRIILSTKVGAMPYRLKDLSNDFWFEIDDFESFRKQFEIIKSLKKEKVNQISKELRSRYEELYSNDVYSKQLKSIVEFF